MFSEGFRDMHGSHQSNVTGDGQNALSPSTNKPVKKQSVLPSTLQVQNLGVQRLLCSLLSPCSYRASVCASAVLSQWGPGWGYRAHFGRDAAVVAQSLLPGAELCLGNSQQHAKSREETHRKALQEQLRHCLTTQEVPAHPEGNNCLPSCSGKTLTAKTAEKKPVCPGLGYLQLTASYLLPFRALPASLKYCEGTWLNSTTTLPYGQAQFT